MRKLKNILRLGRKELWSLVRDPIMLVLITYVFTLSIYSAATALPETMHNATIAIVDDDRSALSGRIVSAFYPPEFVRPQLIDQAQMDAGMERGDSTFTLHITSSFQRDVLAGRTPAPPLSIAATRVRPGLTGKR